MSFFHTYQLTNFLMLLYIFLRSYNNKKTKLWPWFFMVMDLTQHLKSKHSYVVALLYYLLVYSMISWPVLVVEDIQSELFYEDFSKKKIAFYYISFCIPYFFVLIYAHNRYFKKIPFERKMIEVNTKNKLTNLELTTMFCILISFHILSFTFLDAPNVKDTFYSICFPYLVQVSARYGWDGYTEIFMYVN